ncbi:MAG: PilZ domain-containing protein [Rhodospirillales bacterium]
MEQRKAKRFDVKLPLRIVRNGTRQVAGFGETRNMSSAGVLFASDTRLDVGEPLEYVVTLSSQAPNKISLHCLGKVTRLGTPAEQAQESFEVAATLERYEFIRS